MSTIIKKIFILIAFSEIILTINAQTIQSGLLNQRFCSIIKQNNYPGHYNLIQLRCEWHPFVIYLDQNSNLSLTDPNNIYEIEFIRKQSYSASKVSAYEIKANLFEKFKIRKLSFSNLDIKKVHPNAFQQCCEQTLLHLDLSRNKLKRIDQDALSNLKGLRHLNLAYNPNLQLTSENFKDNKNLAYLNLSSNEMENLPERLLANLHFLETIDLSNNNLRHLDACTFYPIYSDLKRLNNLKNTNNISEFNLNAQNNNIECTCDVFYLERAANINLNLVCSGPVYYNNKSISDLAKEDPNNVNCYYKNIEFNCRSKYEDSSSLLKNYETYRSLFIVFACLFFISLFVSLCLWCRIRSHNQKRQESIESASKKSKKTAANTEYKALQQTTD